MCSHVTSHDDHHGTSSSSFKKQCILTSFFFCLQSFFFNNTKSGDLAKLQIFRGKSLNFVFKFSFFYDYYYLFLSNFIFKNFVARLFFEREVSLFLFSFLSQLLEQERSDNKKRCFSIFSLFFFVILIWFWYFLCLEFHIS